MELRLEPSKWGEVIKVAEDKNEIQLLELVPNRSYTLSMRVKRTAENSIQAWSSWHYEYFKTKLGAEQTVLGYDDKNEVVYVAQNKWNIVLDDNLHITQIRESVEDQKNSKWFFKIIFT